MNSCVNQHNFTGFNYTRHQVELDIVRGPVKQQTMCNVDRNLLREQARQKRRADEAERQKKESNPGPLFGAPIKIKRNDAVHRHITDVLGPYDEMQTIVKNPSVIGVIQQPATPAPCQNHDPPVFPSIPNTNVISPVKSSQPRPNGTHPPPKYGRSGRSSNLPDNKGRKNSRSQSRSPSHSKERRRSHGHESRSHFPDRSAGHRSSSQGNSRQSHMDASASNSGSNNQKASSHNPQSRSSSANRHSTGHSPTSDRAPSSERERHHSGSSIRSSGSVNDSVFHSPHGRPPMAKTAVKTSPVKKPPPKPNGVVNGAMRQVLKDKTKTNLKLQMPEGHGKSELSVEKVLKEMVFDEPPLTGLLTPKKEEKFPFPIRKEPAKQLFPKGKHDEPPTLTKHHPLGASEGSAMMPSSEWEKDLDISSDSDADNDQGSRRKSGSDHAAKRASRRSVESKSKKMHDSSDSSSSSESSSGSGSDSDSSSSDNEEEKKEEEGEVEEVTRTPSPSPPVQNRSWKLKNFMNAPGPLSGLPAVNPSILQEINKAQNDDINDRILVDFFHKVDDMDELMDDSPIPTRSDVLDEALASMGIPKAGNNGLLPLNSGKGKFELSLNSLVDPPLSDFGKITTELDEVSGRTNVEAVASEKKEKTTSKNTNKSPGSGSRKSPAGSRSGVGRSPSRRGSRKSGSPTVSESKSEVSEKVVSKSTKSESVLSPISKSSSSSKRASHGSAPKTQTPPRATPPRDKRRTGGSNPKSVRRKNPVPKSQEFVPSSASSDSSDEEDENVEILSPRVHSSPLKMNGDLKPQSSSTTSRQQKSRVSKPRDRTKHVKRTSISSVPDLNDVFDEVIGPSKLLSPLHNPDTTTPSINTAATTATPTTISISTCLAMSPCTTAVAMTTSTTPSILSGLTYVDNRPTIMVRLDRTLLDHIPLCGPDDSQFCKVACMGNGSGNMDCTDGVDTRVPEVDYMGGGDGGQTLPNLGLTPKQVEPVLETLASMELEEGEVLNEEPMESSGVSVNSPQLTANTSTPTQDKVPAEPEPQDSVTEAPSDGSATNNKVASKAAMDNIIAQITNKDTKLPKPAKIPKRKPTSDGAKEDYKRQRRELKTTPKRTADQISDKERTSHKDDHQWDRKNHWRSEEHQSNSSSERESKRSKYERGSGRDSRERDVRGTSRDSREREVRSGYDRERWRDREGKDSWDWDRRSNPSSSHRADPFHGRGDIDAPNGTEHHQDTSAAFNGVAHPAGSQWSAMISGHKPSPPLPPPHTDRRPQRPTQLTLDTEEKLQSADYYLGEAKKLKHQADGSSDRLAKSLMYVEAVLSFIMCGNAMEQDSLSEPNKIYAMYRDTLNLLRHICKFRGSHEADIHEKEKKLSVLSLRIQALLCRKLYKLKKSEASKLKRVIDDHNKSTGGKPVVAQAPSPYQTNWNARSTGTPSPMSPTPSPAGSVGSVGSVGSGNGNGEHRLTNGSLGPSSLSSPSTVSVPQRIHSVTQHYLSIVGNLVQSEEIWDQADSQANDDQEFFQELDCQCGQLNIHSSILELVRFIRLGLHRLKDT